MTALWPDRMPHFLSIHTQTHELSISCRLITVSWYFVKKGLINSNQFLIHIHVLNQIIPADKSPAVFNLNTNISFEMLPTLDGETLITVFNFLFQIKELKWHLYFLKFENYPNMCMIFTLSREAVKLEISVRSLFRLRVDLLPTIIEIFMYLYRKELCIPWILKIELHMQRIRIMFFFYVICWYSEFFHQAQMWPQCV